MTCLILFIPKNILLEMLLFETNGHRTSKSGHRTTISGHRNIKTGHRTTITGHRTLITGHRNFMQSFYSSYATKIKRI